MSDKSEEGYLENPGEDKKFYEAIFDSVADGVFTVDQYRRITSFNRAAERITGLSKTEAIGKQCSDVFHSNICETGCALRQTLETGQEQIDLPANIVDSKGSSIPIRLSTAVIQDPNGTPVGAVESFRALSAKCSFANDGTEAYTLEDIVGKSEAFRKVFTILPDVGESDSTVLIEGPSGPGKDLLARAVHNLSMRRSKPYVAVNCGKLPVDLFESELFGNIKDEQNSSQAAKPGSIGAAEGGTLFFDEVSDLPMTTQVKLLRILEEGEYEPVGGINTKKANVRVVAATNRKLEELVQRGEFREDLYFRLAVVRITIPPLVKRRGDIPYLVEYFIRKFNTKRGKQIAGVTPRVMEMFMQHDFPGNVRELENLIEYGFVLCHDGMIDVHHLPEDFQHHKEENQSISSGVRTTFRLNVGEAEVIRAALKQCNGHIGKTAKELGISRTTLWRKMKKYAIEAIRF